MRTAPKKRHGHVSRDVWDKVTGALAICNVELSPEGEARGAGVRWTVPRKRRE